MQYYGFNMLGIFVFDTLTTYYLVYYGCEILFVVCLLLQWKRKCSIKYFVCQHTRSEKFDCVQTEYNIKTISP